MRWREREAATSTSATVVEPEPIGTQADEGDVLECPRVWRPVRVGDCVGRVHSQERGGAPTPPTGNDITSGAGG